MLRILNLKWFSLDCLLLADTFLPNLIGRVDDTGGDSSCTCHYVSRNGKDSVFSNPQFVLQVSCKGEKSLSCFAASTLPFAFVNFGILIDELYRPFRTQRTRIATNQLSRY